MACSLTAIAVLSTLLCSDAGVVVWACECASMGYMLLVRRVSVLHGVLLCSDAGASIWACDCLHWMLSTLMCSSTGALVGHVRVPACIWGVKYMAVL